MTAEFIRRIIRSPLIKGSAVYGVSSIFGRAIPFFLLPVLTRYLTPAEFGIVSSVFVLQTVLGIVIDFGMGNHFAVNFYSKEQSVSSLISEAVSVSFIISCISAIILLFVAFVFPKAISVGATWIVGLVLASAFRNVYAIFMLNWQLQERPTTYLIFQNALTVAETLLTLLFVVVQRWGWEGRIGANLIAGTFFGATSLLYFVSKSNVRLMYRDITKLWRIGLEGAPMILHGVGGWLISSMDRFLIVAIVSASSGGIYSMASQVASIVGFVTLAFNQAWSPYLYKELSNSGEASKVKLVKITYVYAFVLFALCCVCCLLFVYAIPYIFDNRYAGATKYLPLMLGQMFFWGMYYMVTNYIFYAKKTSILAKLTLVNGCISFLLNIVTIPRYGPWGSAFCGFFISFTYFASVWILSQKIYPMPWKKVIITWIACISNTVRKA